MDLPVQRPVCRASRSTAPGSSREPASEDPLFFAFVDLASGRAVGIGSYLRIDPANGVVEVGHLAFSPLMQRTPVATEAMYLMMRNAFDARLPPLRVEVRRAQCRPRAAPPSGSGFTFEGIFRQAIVYKGRSRDTAWYSVIDREWPALDAAFRAWLDPGEFRRRRSPAAEPRRTARLRSAMAADARRRTDPMARIAIGGFQHETNTFSSIPASFADFEAPDAWPGLTRGDAMLEAVAGINLPAAGFVQEARSLRHELVPLTWCSAQPSGRVTRDAFERITAMLLEDLRARGAAGRRVPGPARRDGRRTPRRRRRRDPEASAQRGRSGSARRREPRLPRQRLAADGAAGHGTRVLPDLSARGHGRLRRPGRTRAARPARRHAKSRAAWSRWIS